MTSPSDGGRARGVATKLTAILHGYLTRKLTDQGLAKVLRKLALELEAAVPVLSSPAAPAAEAENPDALRIFEHWKRRMSKPLAKFTTGRRRIILARLKEGYTVAQLLGAVDACSASRWHMGENDSKTAYNDLTLVFRTGEKVEQFLALGVEANPGLGESVEMERLMREQAQALKAGDTHGANAANARIRALRAGKSN